MTSAELIDLLIREEGAASNRAADRGHATRFGITQATLGRSRGYGREATVTEIGRLTIEEARGIYDRDYVRPFRSIVFDELRAQLVDVSVTSGVPIAVGMLQAELGLKVDHVLGPLTTAKLAVEPWDLVNNALVGRRVAFFSALVDRDPTQLTFLHGWLRRSVSFLVHPSAPESEPT